MFPRELVRMKQKLLLLGTCRFFLEGVLQGSGFVVTSYEHCDIYNVFEKFKVFFVFLLIFIFISDEIGVFRDNGPSRPSSVELEHRPWNISDSLWQSANES